MPIASSSAQAAAKVLPNPVTPTDTAAALGFGAAKLAKPGLPAAPTATPPANRIKLGLAPDQAQLYIDIFAAQETGDWKAADQRIAQLTDKTLLGSVLAARYLDPRYKTSFAEARDWLEAYADLPEAASIWWLAKKHEPGAALRAPVPASAQIASPIEHTDDTDRARLPARPPSISLQPPPRFGAGLQAWRAGKWADAAREFEAVATGNTSSWYAAAAAFWAARSYLVLKQPDKADSWFAAAAEQPRTFYGMLARRTLGLDPDMKFGPQPLGPADLAQLKALPGGRRALALIQVGETDRAEAELRALSTRGNRKLAGAIVALGDIANMPALCKALVGSTDGGRDEALYPVPRWEPRNGFSVDRALLFALMMQESNFEAGARGGAGAAGLMQLMPATARAVARRAGIPLRNVNELLDPVLNLSLGQEYVKLLIADGGIQGNLILVLAAYNTGPAALAKFRSRPEFDHDPLLFIESLSQVSTRLYVERVMTNMWIYRQRLGEQVPDLDALAANDWPTYVSLDVPTRDAQATAPVQHAANR